MSDFPPTLHKKMDAFEESLTEVEDVLKPFLKIPIADLHEKITDHLGKAKLDLIIAYTANSLFWTYLVTQGMDPKNHPIKDELIRIKQCMNRVKQIEEKKKMSRVDTKAAKRFVTSALWEPAEGTEVKKNGTETNLSNQNHHIESKSSSQNKEVEFKLSCQSKDVESKSSNRNDGAESNSSDCSSSRNDSSESKLPSRNDKKRKKDNNGDSIKKKKNKNKKKLENDL